MSNNDLPTTAPQFDTGPLSWVMVEIREALGRSRTALFEAGGRAPEDQATQLQHAKSHLHQAHGALQMVDLDGVGLMTQAAEEALDRFKAGTLKCTADHVQVVAQLYQALVEYLEELLGGAPSQPVRLFPYYRAVQEMVGAERIHPADLFYPDLSQIPGLPLAATPAAADYAGYRQRFEKALLPYLKSVDAAARQANAGALLDAVTLVADAQTESKARTFWVALQSFAELVAGGHIEGGLYVKQLFGLINLQIRRLSQGTATPADGMLRDALFFIAGADAATAPDSALQLRRVFALDGMVPHDYEARRYGQIDLEALALAKDSMAQAKAAWGRLANAEIDPALDAAFGRALAQAAVACEKLGIAPLAALLRQLADVANTAVTAGRSEELALEMASALLSAEHGLEQIRHLPDDFAAHADTIGARLLALVAGNTPPEPAQWQGGLAHQMQQDDTVVALAMEMKTGLRQIEKVLDEYYADPAKRPSLRELDKVLHQLQGALAILDQDDAMRAAQHVKAAVQQLAGGLGDPAQEPRALDEIAQNVGALGFFVDMLAQNPAGAKERFAFDEEHGTFRAVPFRKMPAAESIPVLDEQVPAPPAPVPAPAAPAPHASDAAIEAELLEIFIGEAQEVLGFVDATLARPRHESGSLDNLTMLRRSFHTLKGSGRMVGLNQFADAAASIERVMNVWLAEARPASDDLFALLERAAQELGAWVAELVATGVSARDADALTAAAARVQEGEAFNMEAAAPAELIAVAPPHEEEISAIAAPDQEADSETFADDEVVADSVEKTGRAPDAPPAGNVIEFPSVAMTPPRDDNVKHIGALEIPLPLYNIYLAETDELVRLLTRDFGEWRHEPRRPVTSDALQAAHTLTGTSGTVGFTLLREVAHALELTLESLLPPAPHLDQAQHDLLDFTIERMRQMLQSFALGDMPAAQPELIAALHDLRKQLADTAPAASDDIEARLDTLFAETLDTINSASTTRAPEAPADVQESQEPQEALAQDELHAPVVAPADGDESPLDQLFRVAYNGISGSMPDLEPVKPPAKPFKLETSGDESIDDLFDSAFDDAFAEPPLTQIAAPAPAPAEPEPETVLDVVSQFEAAHDEAMAFEPLLEETPEPAAQPELSAAARIDDGPVIDAEPVIESDSEGESESAIEPEPYSESELFNEPEPLSVSKPITEAEPQVSVDEAQIPVHAELEIDAEIIALAPAEAEILAAAPAIFNDEIDADLLPVFLEEGADLLPQVGEALRAWQRNPADTAPAQSLLRTLHTVKGSARMAGAMRLGQHAHEIETHIENMVHSGSATPQAFDELMAHYDHALLLFEQLQHPEAAQETVADDTGEPAAGADFAQPVAIGDAESELPAAVKSPLVRVRADILDRLVNQAGEVSISRSKLENEVGSLRASLFDFSENLTRLRRQLREVEMQAESQIASRMAVGSERDFDPLEFDRFTRLQELTRMMAESVNDVASFHENLRHGVDAVGDDLVLQARLTRELQRDLMQVRMVPFASIAERLFRVARQSAKEVDKRVNLDIRGGSVEIDRSVLERMAAPFEHLLRNAIVHGIEARQARLQDGKNETGELLLQVSQQGNEVAIAFSDDGAGLDLERIRAKAHSAGLVAPDALLSDAQAADLIFAPGFSTADSLTELAGRGFGMDIVRSEVLALGGRVETLSTPGQGLRFTIHLPLTLAVTQVVLLVANGQTYALPSVLVEQVLHLKGEQLAQVRASGRIDSHEQSLPLHHLSAMLGETPVTAEGLRYVPVLLLRNGNDRLALEVDEVLGNREVVVKNVGPQLARMPGIAGATVLGTGDIVLILNPVALAQHLEHHPELLSQYALAAGEHRAVSAVQAAPHACVMVVDDSLTVRRVMQRLFEREGYQGLLAKDGVDALEQLHELPAAALPALLLVDIEMPRMDGFDLTRNVRSDAKTQAIPVVMITSRSADKHRQHALELGVNAYFGKPFQEQELLAEVEHLLAGG